VASAASSISGISIPFRTPSTQGGDASSIFSVSASSMMSDTTSKEPLLEQVGNAIERTVGFHTGMSFEGRPQIAPTEEYGYLLRDTCEKMVNVLGVEACSGSCHPCAERWAVLYVSPDGRELRTRMRKDVEGDEEDDEDSPESDDSEDEGPVEHRDLETDYHQLKDAVARLLEEFEIPKELESESETKSLSNRTSNNRGRGGRSDPKILGSKNPYLSPNQNHFSNKLSNQRDIVSSRHRSSPLLQHRSNSVPDTDHKEESSSLVIMLEVAWLQCQNRKQWTESDFWFKTLQQLKKLQSPSLTQNGYASLLNTFSRGPRESISRASSAIEEFEAWFVWLKQSQDRHDASVEDMMLGLKALRDKMWFITDVRHSACYEEAKNVAFALKIMGQPTKTLDGKPLQPQKPRLSKSNPLVKTETQVFDLMAASEDHAGPNKLADEQSDMTLQWLYKYGIENFCKGEERIHRFCLEVEKCVNKLVGDGILDGPVLWSSELFKRDKDILDSGRQKGDLFLTGVGTLSIACDEEYETQTARPELRSLDLAHRPSQGSMRSIPRMGSQQSFDSARWSNGRSVDLLDSHHQLGGPNSALAIDTAVTFWSPFHHSSTSQTSIRPRTSSSNNGPLMLRQSATVNDDKRRFLLDLKQTLFGLLLSDLGTAVFSHGSETDNWFSSDLGEECIQRKEEEDRERKRRLAKKKSIRSLKSARVTDHRSNPLDTLGRHERGSPAAPVATLHNAGMDPHSGGEYSTSGAESAARSTMSAAKRAGLLEFPYNIAFRSLLKKFATHPNPFSKLQALYELEQIIVASLSSRNRHYHRRETLPTVPQSQTLGSVLELSSREPSAPMSRAQNLEQAIANCAERRSLAQQQQDRDAGNASPNPYRSAPGTRSPTGPPSTDMIVEVLQGLFRDADIRPKTLFRDLQYIASFVPASMLDKSARGKAFWDAGVAALGLKQDVCRVMIEIADEIVAFNTQNRSASVQSSTQASTTPLQANHTGSSTGTTSSGPPATTATGVPVDNPLAKYTMQDAAKMLVITAKEGDAVAERELAIFYLTHPDLVSRTVLPLTRPKDVFRAELLQRELRNTNSNSSKKSSAEKDEWGVGKADPLTMCVAQHWMEMSKRGGDSLAAKYLRARDEMERIP
jgi:hypothetical protein